VFHATGLPKNVLRALKNDPTCNFVVLAIEFVPNAKCYPNSAIFAKLKELCL
jgi:hypothetical protein